MLFGLFGKKGKVEKPKRTVKRPKKTAKKRVVKGTKRKK